MPTQKPVNPVPDDAHDDHIVTPEEETLIRERLQTADEDAKTARPAKEFLEELLRRSPHQ
jgi:hypothetical protein